jgi:tRNA uridine 5-carbamoylmethylation protein Kti12
MSEMGDMKFTTAGDMTRPIFMMLTGVPGSGKSTWLKDNGFMDRIDCMILSTDNYIQQIANEMGKTYSEVFRDTIKDAENNLYKSLNVALDYELDIIWDQTNLTRKIRMNKLKHIPLNYHRMAMVFPTPEPKTHTAWLNSEARVGKTIPDAIIHSMIENFEHPAMSEGFNSIQNIVR